MQNLVGLRNSFKNAFNQIDVQIERRYDLIPNLVETAKGHLKHERETIEAVVAARNQASEAERPVAAVPGNASKRRDLAGAETILTGALGRMLAIAEQHPDLKANQTMLRLMEELSSTENNVAFSRQAYNDAVMVYNTRRESFPHNLIASHFGFTEAHRWELEHAAQWEAPKLSFCCSGAPANGWSGRCNEKGRRCVPNDD